MFVWQAHEGAVTSLAFVPGGGLLSTGRDGNVRLWDTASGSLQNGWKFADATHSSASDLVRVLCDCSGRFAAVALRSEVLQFFDLADGSFAGEFALSGALGFAPAPDGASVFVVGRVREHVSAHSWQDARVYQHAYPPGGVLAFSQSTASSGALAIHPNGTQLRVGGARFSWPDGAPLGPLIIHPGGSKLAVSWDGDKLFGPSGSRLLVTGFQFGTVRQRLKGHVAEITALAATPNGRRIWTASADATVRQWDVDTYCCERWYRLPIGPLGCVAVSPDGLTAAAGSTWHGSVAMWDLE